MNAQQLVSLAERMGLAPVHAVALPAVVEVAAQKAGVPPYTLVRLAEYNDGLRDYLAGLCVTAVEAVRAEVGEVGEVGEATRDALDTIRTAVAHGA